MLDHPFQRLAKPAGLRTIRFHDLRHTAATLLLLQGVPLRVAMEILRHSQISLTMRMYSHMTPAMHEEAAAGMDAILDPMATQKATVQPTRAVQ